MRFSLSILAIIFFTQQLLVAQQPEPRVTAVIDERQIGAGVPSVLLIIADGGSPAEIPEIIQAEGLDIRKLGFRLDKTVIGGVPTNRAIITYSVTGDKPGDFEIPSVSFQIYGGTYKTEAIKLRVIALGGGQPVTADKPYFMSFTAAKKEAYVNESITIVCKVYARGADSLRAPGIPKIENADKFVIKPFPITYQIKLEQIQTLPYSTTQFPTSIFALSPGEFDLGPAVIRAQITEYSTGSNPGIRRPFPEHRTITSDKLSFHIKPLPTQGKPEGFLGAVGSFVLNVETADTDVRIGDPISVDIKVSGTGNFDSVVAPEIAESEGWRVYSANRIDNGAVADIERTIIFNQVVIPMAEHTALPAVRLSYFDPKKAEYVSLKSPPIPLKIAPDDQARSTISPIASFVGVPEEELNDILFIHTGSVSWTPIISTFWTRPSFWLLEIVPFLAFLSIVGFGIWRVIMNWLDRRRTGEQLSFEQVKEKLGHDRVSRGLFYKLVLEYFYRWRAENEQLLAKVSNDTRSVLEKISETGHTFLYSGAAGQGEPVAPDEKQAALKALSELHHKAGAAVE